MELVRADGSREAIELETRSCLWHDLVHFALESEARLGDGFYGRLARGARYASLAQDDPFARGSDTLAMVERVVGPLQTAVRKGLDAPAFVATLRSHHEQLGEPSPPWLDADLLARVAERLRALDGRWRATRFGDALELRFDPAATA